MQSNEVAGGISAKYLHEKKNYRINVHMRANGRPSRRSKSSYNIEHPIRDTSLEKEEKRGEKKNIYE
jgi:hypothetical protein